MIASEIPIRFLTLNIGPFSNYRGMPSGTLVPPPLARVFIDIRDPSPAVTCGDVELSPSQYVKGRRRLRVELGRSLELLRDAAQLAPLLVR
jgi:hypothetical protein